MNAARRAVTAGALFGVLAAGAVGCSSSSTPGHAANTGTPAGASSNAPAQTAASTPAAAGGGGSAAAFCAEVRKQTHILALGNFDVSHVDRNAYQAELARIVAVAPGVIKADVQAIVAIQIDLINGHYDPKKLSDPSLVQHTQHLATWMQTNCPGAFATPSG